MNCGRARRRHNPLVGAATRVLAAASSARACTYCATRLSPQLRDIHSPALQLAHATLDSSTFGGTILIQPANETRPPVVPWVLAPNTQLGTGIPFAGNDAGPFLGTFDSEAACRDFCATQPNCTQYTWNNISTNRLWTKRCYGRHESAWFPSHYPGCYSGRRVEPLPSPAGPPPPVLHPGAVSLDVQDGTAPPPPPPPPSACRSTLP